jgi:hypothetical protein
MVYINGKRSVFSDSNLVTEISGAANLAAARVAMDAWFTTNNIAANEYQFSSLELKALSAFRV